jgi:polyisoprenyl-teichoic acid--peptidoglycan teichoic acid transferase
MAEIKKIPITIVERQKNTQPASGNLYTEPIVLPSKPKSKTWLIVKLFLFIVIFSFLGLLAYSSQIPLSGQNSSTNILSQFNLIGQIKNLAESADKKLKGEESDRINIVLLGMGGKGHDGSYLTDTIMLTSLQPSTKKVAMISIPRDLSVPIEGYGWRKINSINAFAEQQKEGSGGLAVSQALSDLLNIPVDYFVRVDFTGFMNIIDKVGGVDINVENTFDDYSYPVLGREDLYPISSRYEHLHFDKGWQKMDGSTALKYARSRHGYGVEGSDFARAKRQQKVIEAVKEKTLGMNIIFKPKMITDIITELTDHISTNLNVWEMVKLWSMFKDTNSANIINKVLDNGPDGLLVNERGQDGAYLLAPKSGDFAEIQYMVANILATASNEDKTKIQEEAPTIAVLNGTWVNGLAAQQSLDLEKFGFKVLYIGNCAKKDFQKSVIYDMQSGEKSKSKELLTQKINADILYGSPEWLTDETVKMEKHLEKDSSGNFIRPDFILILGKEKDQTSSGVENVAK